MTEKEFLKLFNNIDDKFINEEQKDITPLYPVEIKPVVKRFAWGNLAAAAAACVVVIGGLFAVGHFADNGGLWVGNSTTDPSSTATEVTAAAVTDTVETETPIVIDDDLLNTSGELPRDRQPVLYATKLNCNGKRYDLTVLMHRIRGFESPDGVTDSDKSYIWGDVALELSLDGEVKNTLWVYEYCYGFGQNGGMPFDIKNLGSDYFRVLEMEQDVLAYITPNKPFGTEDENAGVILNAMFFTVDKDDNLICIRNADDDDREEMEVKPNAALIIPEGCYFKITPDFDIESNLLVLLLNKPVKNPWVDHGDGFEAGKIPVSFDFENYLLNCEDEGYKYLVYYVPDDYPPLTLMDGSYASNIEILRYDDTFASRGYDHYSVDACYAVPFFTSAENRVAGEQGAWFKLKRGIRMGDFYVDYARSDYYPKEDAGFYPYSYQCEVGLYGDLSCTATAEKIYDSAGGEVIRFTLDRESCENLFSLQPSIKAFDDEYADAFTVSFEDERIYFILTEDMKNYYKVFESLKNSDLVKVTLDASEFSLNYSFFTESPYDGMTWIQFDDDNYTLEFLD